MGYINQPWIGSDDVEMAAGRLRKMKKVLQDGGIVHVRGSMEGVSRYASIIQGPGEHEKTSIDGSVLAVSADMTTIMEGELHLDPLAAAIEKFHKLFVSRTGFVHEDIPTVFAFQFPSGAVSRRSSEASTNTKSDKPVSPLSHPGSSSGIKTFAPLADSPPSVQSRSIWSWISAPLRWFGWNFTRWSIIEDARHAPVIILLGKAWSWSLAVPYVQIPLGILTALWSIQALNVTWAGIWTNALTVVGRAAVWVFNIMDEFFDHSVYFRVIVGVVGFYLLIMCTVAVFLAVGRGFMWILKRLRFAWKLDVLSPTFACSPRGLKQSTLPTDCFDVIEPSLPPIHTSATPPPSELLTSSSSDVVDRLAGGLERRMSGETAGSLSAE